MAKFEKINGAFFRIEAFKGMTKTQFANKYKNKRKHPFDVDDTWAKIQAELKKQESKPEKKVNG